MMPRLGDKYGIEIETVSKPKAEFHTDEYYTLDLPVAPAVMVGEEIVVEGSDIDEHTVDAASVGPSAFPRRKFRRRA